jgi:glyoxalase family protein
VNFDDPGSYHFYFSSGAGSPGTLLTFFPWVNGRRSVAGSGMIAGVSIRGAARGEEDPDGTPVQFVAGGGQKAGLHSLTLSVQDAYASAEFFRDVLGFSGGEEAGDRLRLAVPGGGIVDLLHSPGVPRAKMGAGAIHHVAFRASDESAQQEWRERLTHAGVRVSPVKDRLYFHSIYFREPGGVLLEIATDGPGFAVDEDAQHLGERLCLPPWLEPSRASIEKRLPPLREVHG